MTDEAPEEPRDLRPALRIDVQRALAMAAGGALGFAPIEYAITLVTYAGSVTLGSKLRLMALVGTLALGLWALLAVALIVLVGGARLVRVRIDPDTATAPGLFALTPLRDGVRPAVAALWAAVVVAAGLGLVMQRAAAWALTHYKEPQLTAALIAVAALALAALAAPLHRGLTPCARLGARTLASLVASPTLTAWNPLGRWRAAGLALLACVTGALLACWFGLPQSRSVLPVRLIVSGMVITTGMGFGALWAARRGSPPSRTRRRALTVAALALALVVTTLLRWGADLETKYIAITASPALTRLVALVRLANDLDRDGFGSLLGEADCAPLTRSVHPGAIDIPGDGIDQNCDGRDFSLADLTVPAGPTAPVPPAFQRPWNILLLTIDTVRYDRTSFGGYKLTGKRRDTTPRLAELVAASTSFTFAQAPSAGTMASIPAILTSKFFHSGLALDEQRPPGTPPKIMPENTTLPEIVKRRGYRTGVIGSHEWWNDWGLDQGVDDYDNSIGETPDPYRVAADQVTDHALAWISRHQSKQWLLWAHYIDPHGRYVAHPNVVDWGTAEPDLYDAELRWTDQQIGRLLDELRRLPSFAHTIIIITSDHGDSMGEHTVPLGTHGTALYREMLHVPLIVYVPDNPPRTIGGAVTNLDIVPTVAELVGADVSDLAFEGRSLVPQIFYGREDRERIVFAETNAPGKQRAAISEHYKLIYYLSTNLVELFDLHADPWEKTNLAPRAPAALATMRSALDAWMERVLYARDPVFNQAFRQLADVVLPAAPTPPVPIAPKLVAGGAVEVLGLGPAAGATLLPGTTFDLHVFLRAVRPSAAPAKLQVVVWPVPPGASLPAAGPPLPATAVRGPLRPTAEGANTSDRWKPGEYIRERFQVTAPAAWSTASRLGVAVTIVAAGASETVILGSLPFEGSPASPAP